MSELPFKQFNNSGKLIRIFDKAIDPDELIWHRDRDWETP